MSESITNPTTRMSHCILSNVEIDHAHKAKGTVPPNAHVTPDYPDGFRIRCKRADWTERTRYGVRWTHATSDERHNRPDRWRAPKASVYHAIVLLYTIDDPTSEEHGHVKAATLSEFAYTSHLVDFRATWGPHLPPSDVATLDRLERKQAAFDRRKVTMTEIPSDASTI